MTFRILHICLLLSLASALAACSGDSSGSHRETYSVSATIADLKGTIGLTLNNTYTVSASDSQAVFPQALALADSYEISITDQPAEQTCAITETPATAEIKDGDVVNVKIECSYSTLTRITTTDYGFQDASHTSLVQTEVFNHQGHLILSYVESSLFLTPLFGLVYSYNYDTDGKLIHASNSDGVTIDYAYDESGRLTVSSQLSDGESTVINRYRYDDAGNLISTSSENVDGVVSYSYATYNELGQMIYYEYDRNGDGVIDNRFFDYYDDRGYRIRRESDHDGDGEPDSFSTTDYDRYGNATRLYINGRLYREIESDSRGNILSLADYGQYSQPENADQYSTKSTYHYTYDEQDNQTSLTFDSDGDDVNDVILHYSLEYNGAGVLTKIDVDDDSDGQVDRQQTFRYEGDLRIQPALDGLQNDYLSPASFSWLTRQGHCCGSTELQIGVAD